MAETNVVEKQPVTDEHPHTRAPPRPAPTDLGAPQL